MAIERKRIKNESSIPIGMIATFWLQPSQCPDGWVICDGRSYVDINGQTQTAPYLIGLYPLFSNNNIGTGIEAGLPSFDATFRFSGGTHHHTVTGGYWHAPDSGSLDTWNVAGGRKENVSQTGTYDSKSKTYTDDGAHSHTVTVEHPNNSIYGKSETVTPPSIRLLVCMKIR